MVRRSVMEVGLDLRHGKPNEDSQGRNFGFKSGDSALGSGVLSLQRAGYLNVDMALRRLPGINAPSLSPLTWGPASRELRPSSPRLLPIPLLPLLSHNLLLILLDPLQLMECECSSRHRHQTHQYQRHPNPLPATPLAVQ